jgi:hypothetical protein
MERKVYVKQEGDGGWCFRIFWQLCTRQKWSCLDLSLRAVDCCAEEVKFALYEDSLCSRPLLPHRTLQVRHLAFPWALASALTMS